MRCLIILYLIVKNQLVFFFHPKDLFVLSQSPKTGLGNKVINFCDSVTYLGVKISAN